MNKVLMTDSVSETNRHAAKPLLASAQRLLRTWCSSVPGAGAALSPGAVQENAVGASCLLQQQPQPLQRRSAQHQPGHGLSCSLLSPPALHLFFTLPSCSGLLVLCTQHSPPFLNTFREVPQTPLASLEPPWPPPLTDQPPPALGPPQSQLRPAGAGWDRLELAGRSTGQGRPPPAGGAKGNGRPCRGRGAAAPAIS